MPFFDASLLVIIKSSYSPAILRLFIHLVLSKAKRLAFRKMLVLGMASTLLLMVSLAKKKIKIFAVLCVIATTVAAITPMPYNFIAWCASLVFAVAIFEVLGDI